jgi:hypothetical protein
MKPFILGKCNCGFCDNDIPIRNVNGFIQKYKHGHNPAGYTALKGVNHPNYRNGKRKHKDGYILVYSPNHPYKDSHNQLGEHRLVLEEYYTKKWGYRFYLHPRIAVHHINGIKSDNRVENLKMMTFAQHRKHHSNLKPISDRSNWVCFLCNQKTTVHRPLKNGRIQPLYYRYDNDRHICSRCYDEIRNKKVKERNG